MKYSLSMCSLKKAKLVFWILLRAFTASISPLMVPTVIRVMFDCLETGNKENFIISSLVVIIVLIPCFSLSYYIALRSDPWVIDAMYGFEKNSIMALCKGSYYLRKKKYDDPYSAHVINSGAWGMIQIWLQLFRIVAPFISIIVLIVYSTDYYLVFFILVIVSILIDFASAKIQNKRIIRLNENMIVAEGNREKQLKELLCEAEFISMNHLKERQFSEYETKRSHMWRASERILFNNLLFDFAHSLFDIVYKIVLYDSLLDYSLSSTGIVAGNVSSADSIFATLRAETADLKNQIKRSVEKTVPIDTQREIIEEISFNPNDYFSCEDLVFRVENLCFSYADSVILRNLTFDISKGEKIAIIGHNGSGKSTLLNLLAGNIIKDYTGTLSFYGISSSCSCIGSNNRSSCISYVPANKYIFSQSIYRNLMMGTDKYISEEEMLHFFENYGFDNESSDDNLMSREAQSLSGGEAQRLSIARAKISNRSVMILDELTSALDDGNAKKVFDQLFVPNTTIVYTTHKINELKYSTRVIYMVKGKIEADMEYENFVKSKFYSLWIGQL